MRRTSTSLYRTLLLTLAMLMVAAAAAMASVPRSPIGLRYTIAGGSGSHYIYLMWSAPDSSEEVTPYHVYQGSGRGGGVSFSQVATVQDSGGHGYYMVLPEPGVYTFYVTAFNNDGESAPSNYVTVDFSNIQIEFDPPSTIDTLVIGQGYTHTARTQPIAGDSALTFSIVNPLPGMSIDPSTGVFTWVPDQVGLVTVRVRGYLADHPEIEGFQDLYLIVVPQPSSFCATIRGTVLYADGDTVRSGVVVAMPLDSLHTTTRTGMIVDGHYSIAVEDSFFYTVAVAAGANYEGKWEPTPVMVGCGDYVIVDFAVNRVANTYDSVSGYVRLRADSTPVMAIVTALDSNQNILGEARTDQYGRYIMVVRTYSPYFVHAEPLDSMLLDQYYDHAPTFNAATPLSPSMYHTGIDFDLGSRVVYHNSISGTLIGKTNDLIDGVVTAYTVTQRSGHVVVEYASQTVTNGGSFSISGLNPGTYVLFATPLDSASWMPGYYREHHKAERDWEDATQLTIDVNTALTGVEIKLDKADGNKGHGRVHGMISGEGGTTKHNGNDIQGLKPLAGAYVYAIDANGLVSNWAVTDQTGSYEIDGLGSGVYVIQVDYLGFKGSQVVVTVAEDGAVGNVPPVTLQPAESVSGVPVAGASIAGIQAYPNPARNGLTLGFNALHGEATVRMTNATGFEVLARTITTVDGANTVALETSSLGSGLYFVTVTSGRGVVSVPVTIVH